MTSPRSGLRWAMGLNFYAAARRTPDILMEELVSTLLCAKSFEFKVLFTTIHTTLKEKKIGGGGEEMLRLRTYDKLQNLVRDGNVTKTAGKYRGVKKQLLLVADQLKERHSPKPFVPGALPANK